MRLEDSCLHDGPFTAWLLSMRMFAGAAGDEIIESPQKAWASPMECEVACVTLKPDDSAPAPARDLAANMVVASLSCLGKNECDPLAEA